jgi:GT2 family glycosyltransferase
MKMYLATMDFTADGPLEMVGANCAIRRAVLERVPQFDPELGPGALGLGEDTLFGHQLMKAGFKIGYAEKAVVVHWPDDSRLLRGEWLNAARQRGRSKAYLLYHWEHADIRFPRIKSLWFWLKLWLRRILQPPPKVYNEGCPPWELSYVQQLATCKSYCRERLRPRNYVRQGLVKVADHRHSR